MIGKTVHFVQAPQKLALPSHGQAIKMISFVYRPSYKYTDVPRQLPARVIHVIEPEKLDPSRIRLNPNQA